MRFKQLSLIKLVTVFLIIGMGSSSFAGCGKPDGKKHLVITMEGLMGRILGSRARRLASSVQSNSGYQVASYSHTTANGIMINCIKRWKEAAGPDFRLSVIGHSFGGRDALKLAKALNGTGLKINDLIILDGREGSDTGSACRGNMSKPYPKPPNVGKVTNFYGCNSALNGRLIAGAENHYVNNSHIGIPNDAYVRSKVRNILGGSGGGPVAPNTGVAAASHPDVVNLLGNAARRAKSRSIRLKQVKKRATRADTEVGIKAGNIYGGAVE